MASNSSHSVNTGSPARSELHGCHHGRRVANYSATVPAPSSVLEQNRCARHSQVARSVRHLELHLTREKKHPLAFWAGVPVPKIARRDAEKCECGGGLQRRHMDGWS